MPENLETGEYVDNPSEMKLLNLGQMQYCLSASADENGTNIIPIVNQGILSGLTFTRKTKYTDLITVIQNYVKSGNGDAIVNVYQAPEACFKTDASAYTQVTVQPDAIDGYIPKIINYISIPIVIVWSTMVPEYSILLISNTVRMEH